MVELDGSKKYDGAASNQKQKRGTSPRLAQFKTRNLEAYLPFFAGFAAGFAGAAALGAALPAGFAGAAGFFAAIILPLAIILWTTLSTPDSVPANKRNAPISTSIRRG